jgi:threonylcarbamoyladenosine tRNA methylthiotransferase MtaB
MLTEDHTVCMFEGARRDRARINAFHSKPLAEYKNRLRFFFSSEICYINGRIMKRFYVHTTGCKANQWDSYVVSDDLKRAGLADGSLKEADIIVINACTLTGGAERDIRRFISRARRENEGAKVILTGCHGQVYPERAFGADLVLGQEEKFHIAGFLGKSGVFRAEKETSSLEKLYIDTLPVGKTRFFLKIQDGCHNFCSYCIVPFARGTPRSRPAHEILEIMKSLKEKGVKEVVLTGIEISAYRDPATGMDLRALLTTFTEAETSPRIRMSSVDPRFIDDEFIEIMAGSEKIMKSIHIPLQSGSDDVLERMGRRYTREFMRDLIERLTTRIPHIGIGLDVIVGFPGEDQDRFMETVKFLESTGSYYLHVFPFSARIGTKAAEMDGKVSEMEKKERVRLLRSLDVRKRQVFYDRFIGKKMRIIPEGKVYKGKYMRGYTDNYLPLYLPYEKKLENCLLEVTIEGIEDGLLRGSITR